MPTLSPSSDDLRCPFDEAVESLRLFLREHGWPDGVLWLASAHRVTGVDRDIFVFRPGDLEGEAGVRAVYEDARSRPGNISIAALGQVGGRSLVQLRLHGGSSLALSMNLPTDPLRFHAVQSRWRWLWIRAWCRMRGKSGWLWTVDGATELVTAADGASRRS